MDIYPANKNPNMINGQPEADLGLPRTFMPPANLIPKLLQEHYEGLEVLRQILAEQAAEKEGISVEQVLVEIPKSSKV